MTLKELRTSKNLTQQSAADLCGIPLRTYSRYELDSNKEDTIKYNFIFNTLSAYGFIDEEHGVLTLEMIERTVAEVLSHRDVEFCYLFGSYSKGKANDKSDVDLIISTSITGLKFYGLVEELRTALHKKVDLLTVSQLEGNADLLNEVLKDGIKIYGQRKG